MLPLRLVCRPSNWRGERERLAYIGHCPLPVITSPRRNLIQYGSTALLKSTMLIRRGWCHCDLAMSAAFCGIFAHGTAAEFYHLAKLAKTGSGTAAAEGVIAAVAALGGGIFGTDRIYIYRVLSNCKNKVIRPKSRASAHSKKSGRQTDEQTKT